MKKNRTYKVNAFLMMLLAGTLSFSATAAASESGLLPEAAAQQQLVKGTIVDVNGNPIPGASVMVPGSTTGTVTQIDGTFSLNVAEGTKVEIGCLGYTTVTTTARNGMKVVLKEDAMMLSDVVVVGYGTQKRLTLREPLPASMSDRLSKDVLSPMSDVDFRVRRPVSTYASAATRSVPTLSSEYVGRLDRTMGHPPLSFYLTTWRFRLLTLSTRMTLRAFPS